MKFFWDHTATVNDISIDFNLNIMISVSDDGTMRKYDLTTGNSTKTISYDITSVGNTVERSYCCSQLDMSRKRLFVGQRSTGNILEYKISSCELVVYN